MLKYFLAAMLFSSQAMALSCVDPKQFQEEKPNIFLVRMLSVKKGLIVENRQRPAVATIEVLKVFRGDVETLSKIDTIEIDVSCDGVWGPACSVLSDRHYPYRQHRRYLVFSDYPPSIYFNMCGSNTRSGSEGLEEFEAQFPPIWTR